MNYRPLFLGFVLMGVWAGLFQSKELGAGALVLMFILAAVYFEEEK